VEIADAIALSVQRVADLVGKVLTSRGGITAETLYREVRIPVT
jgi:hypothetical protein